MKFLSRLPKNATVFSPIQRQTMNRPRNRQVRPPRPTNTHSNKYHRSSRDTRNGISSNVPSTVQVTAGATVSIVQKADQPTGREVRGVVQDVLTRGDHPRGIKVRLQDGRIGRVQRMATTGDDTTSPSEVGTALAKVPASAQESRNANSSFEAADGNPRSNLGDYVVSSRRQKNSRSPLPQDTSPSQASAVVCCPICQAFEGDEAAVSYHVQEHLDNEPEVLE